MSALNFFRSALETKIQFFLPFLYLHFTSSPSFGFHGISSSCFVVQAYCIECNTVFPAITKKF